MSYRSEKSGVQVDALLDKIDALENATQLEDGTMSKEDKKKLDEQVADDELTIQEIGDLLNF